MKVDGTYTMAAPRQQVFDTLMDTGALTQCLPGVEKFEEVGEGRYDVVLKAGVAGIKGTFTGTVTLDNARPPEGYRLSMDGSFAGGHVKGAGDITLVADGEKTNVSYSGEAQVSGRLAGVGQRLITPAARMMAGRFFKCMEEQVKSGETVATS